MAALALSASLLVVGPAVADDFEDTSQKFTDIQKLGYLGRTSKHALTQSVLTQLSAKTDTPISEIAKVTIWGNHSSTQYPDLSHATVGGRSATEAIGDQAWVADEFIPTVAKRGAAIIDARGSSSAASAANAAIDHIRSWTMGTPEGDWVSMAIPSDGSYGVDEGLISSFPCTCADGEYSIVQGLDIDDFSRERIDASVTELREERDAVAELGLL